MHLLFKMDCMFKPTVSTAPWYHRFNNWNLLCRVFLFDRRIRRGRNLALQTKEKQTKILGKGRSNVQDLDRNYYYFISIWHWEIRVRERKNILTKTVKREALPLLLTHFIVFESGNAVIRLLNPSQPPRRHAATGHATQADKRDASARLLSTSQINKIRPWCAQTRSPRGKWCNTVLKKFFLFFF